jgi:hypothetical protein
MPLREHGGAEARERWEVVDLKEDDNTIGFGEKTVHFSGGGRPALQRVMTSS